MSGVDTNTSGSSKTATSAVPSAAKSITDQQEQAATSPALDANTSSSVALVEPLEYNDTTIDPAQLQNDSHASSNDNGSGDTEGSTETCANQSSWAQDEYGTKRVKVYELIGTRWVDQGTAFCLFTFNPETQEAFIVARAEANYENLILTTAIRSNDVYQRQQETLIVWTEPDGSDYALSFQDPEGCAEIWSFIVEVQQHLNSNEDSHHLQSSSPMIGPEHDSSEHGITTGNIIRSGALPVPALGNVALIDQAIKTLAKTQAFKERICEYIQAEGYIKSMILVMRHAEDIESLDDLHDLCGLMQTILSMNDHTLYEHICDDDLFFGVVGMLEYDPEFPSYKANYRDFLVNTTHFLSPIPIRNPQIHQKIHTTYRLLFLKDVVLARSLDDSTFNIINSCIIFNQVEIISHVQTDHGFLREVVGLFVDDDMLSGGQPKRMPENSAGSTAKQDNTRTTNGHSSRTFAFAFAPPEDLSDDEHAHRRSVVQLIQHLCSMGKNVQLPARMALFRALVDRGVLFVVQWGLSRPNPETNEASRLTIGAAGEILAALLEHDVNGVRGHVLKQVIAIEKEREADKSGADKADTILALLCRVMASSRTLSVQSQVGDALKVLLEIPPNEAPPESQTALGVKLLGRAKDDPGTEKFLDNFYKVCMDILIKPFDEIPEVKNLCKASLHFTREKTNLFVYVCDLLSNFTLQHSFRSHFFILSSNISAKIASLMSSRDKHLRLASLRFFRICIRLNNGNLIKHLIKNDIFTPIFRLTMQETLRDNLISSSCLEFFEYIRRENIKQILDHCMSNHEISVRQLAQNPISGSRFVAFLQRWEINHEPPPELDHDYEKKAKAQWLNDMRQASAAEENYFNADDDDELSVAPPSIFSLQSALSDALPTKTRRRRSSGFALGKVTNGNGNGHSLKRLSAGPPRPPSRTSLVQYGDDEDEDDPVEGSSVGGSMSTSNIVASTSQPASASKTNLAASPVSFMDDEDEDDLLEALVRSSEPIKFEPAPVAPPTKRRRNLDEEEDADFIARLASKAKRPDLGLQKNATTASVANGTSGDDPPKKIKLKFDLASLGKPPKSTKKD